VIKGNKKIWLIIVLTLFIAHIFLAPRRVPQETVLRPVWVTSLVINNPFILNDFPTEGERVLLPFTVGDRFGFVGDDGYFTINRARGASLSISERLWAEYDTLPSSIQVMNPYNEVLLVIDAPGGYPLFLDNRVFLVGHEQNSITALGTEGQALWTFDFPSPITTVDAANGYLLAGTLDGMMILLNPRGVPVFPPFEPLGSRLSVILGSALSRDASHMALISGIDNQRFLLIERTGDTHRVIHHEFLSEGFRRPVHINFVDNDTRIVFEREGGLGIYTINTRASINIDLDGEILSMGTSGEGRFLFAITSQGPTEKRLVTIRFPGIVVSEAPFESENTFLAHRGSRLFIAGDTAMASFELESR